MTVDELAYAAGLTIAIASGIALTQGAPWLAALLLLLALGVSWAFA